MPTTSVYAFPYQSLSDPPHGPDLGQDLAERIEAVLQGNLTLGANLTIGGNLVVPGTATVGGVNIGTAITDLQNIGYVGEDVELATSATSTGSEAFSLATVTFTAVSTRRYKITWTGTWATTVNADIMRLRIRGKAGATVDSTGTELRIITVKAEATGSGQSAVMQATVTGITGQYTVGVSIHRVVGTGSCTINSNSTDHSYLLVERIA